MRAECRKIDNAGVNGKSRKNCEGIKNGLHRAPTQHVDDLVHARVGNLCDLRYRVKLLAVIDDPNTRRDLVETQMKGTPVAM